MARSAFNCPACSVAVLDTSTACDRCGADLSLLHQLDGLADAWFNSGVSAAAEGNDGLALERVSAYCVIQPGDAEARLVQAKLWARLGCLCEARHAVSKARELDPERTEIDEVERAIDDLSKLKVRRESGTAPTSETEGSLRAECEEGAAPAQVEPEKIGDES